MAKPPEHVEKFDFDPDKIKVYNPIVRFIGSLKLGLTVLTLILIASTIGEFLPTDNDFSVRVVFRTWWYRALLIIQGVNLIVNTYMTYVEETYPQFLPFFRKNPDQHKLQRIHHKANFKDTRAPDSLGFLRSLAGAFSLKGYRTFYDENGLYAHRGLLARFGSTVTHAGLITIIIGALAESYLKTDGVVRLLEGESTDRYITQEGIDANDLTQKRPLGFTVKLRDFEFYNYPGTGTAEKNKSTVTFIPREGEPTHDYVRVNHDIKYGGWTFHQTSYQPIDQAPRFFVKLSERGSNGGERPYQFETNVDAQSRDIIPLPGRDDRFFCAETDEGGRAVIWSVASKDEIVSRGTASLFGNMKIEMVHFYPDFGVDSEQRKYVNKSNELRNPAAYIEISSNNEVVVGKWIFDKESPLSQSRGGESEEDIAKAINFVITEVHLDPGTVGGSATAPVVGKMDDSAGAANSGDEPATSPIEKRAVVTVALRKSSEDETPHAKYNLRLGETVDLTPSGEEGLNIPGDFKLAGFHKVPAYMDDLAVSKNPGIPVVWLGAILASFGPFIAFFVSRRRVWAYVDWNKKSFWVSGESRYSREALEDEIAEVIQKWSSSDEVKTEPEFKFPRPGELPRLSQHL